LCVGGLPPDTPGSFGRNPAIAVLPDFATGPWESVAEESDGLPAKKSDWGSYVWVDQSVAIWVSYRDGKAIEKNVYIRIPPWKLKAREWLDRLRGS